MFERVDASGDHKISLEEFKKAMPTMKKWGVEVEDPEKEFKGLMSFAIMRLKRIWILMMMWISMIRR